MATSVRIFGRAFPTNEPLRLIQYSSLIGSHAFEIGVHWKTQTAMIAMAQATTTAARTIAGIRTVRMSKARQYMSRTEILMIAIVAT